MADSQAALEHAEAPLLTRWILGSHHANRSAAPQVTPKRVGADDTTECCQGENPRAGGTVAVVVQRQFLKREPCTSILLGGWSPLGGEGSRTEIC